MTTETMLGKIKHAHFGLGGYQDEQFGLSLTLSGNGWEVGTFIGFWGPNVKTTEDIKWSEEDRSSHYARIMRETALLFQQAKKRRVQDLPGTPVEAVFEDSVLQEWRILTEVL